LLQRLTAKLPTAAEAVLERARTHYCSCVTYSAAA
jgi:hypothetical protein